MPDIFNLNGQTALITGGGSGIGFGIAEQMILVGAKVVISGRSKDKLNSVKSKLGNNCFAFASDVTEKEKHQGLILNIENNIGPISILVNNAGVHCKKASIETTDMEFQSVMDTNVNSIFALTREVLKFMIPRKKGSIINISSMSALYGLPQVAAYSSSKSALLGMTRTLASEYSNKGIRFNCVAPGFIESEMFWDIMKKAPARKEKILDRTPAGRFGTPTDIGRAVSFLASDAADFITGVCLPVDGGNSIGF
jgi:NAD(P)-dependent dehydrogenase (short-subunit alcohol dehydrogenase family)